MRDGKQIWEGGSLKKNNNIVEVDSFLLDIGSLWIPLQVSGHLETRYK